MLIEVAQRRMPSCKASRRFTFTVENIPSNLRWPPPGRVDDLNCSTSDQAGTEHLQSEPSLLDLLRLLPDTEGIEFDPSPVEIQLRPFNLD